jgi:hypothetical protein
MADPISAIALGTAASAATATSAATAATAGLFTTVAAGATVPTFSIGATLSTLGTAASIGSTIIGSQVTKGQAAAEARQSEFNAKQEEIRGLEEANAIKMDVARALASSNARGAASGVSISSGSPVTAQKEALRDANNALSTAGTNSKLRAETDRVRAQLSRSRGRNAVRSGYAKTASILGNFAVDQADRGVFSF